MSVRRGAVTGFLGPNGSGKTALKAIVGIARPTAGRAVIHDLRGEAAHADARLLGVYIEPTGAHPARSARNHLRSLAAVAGLPVGRVEEVRMPTMDGVEATAKLISGAIEPAPRVRAAARSSRRRPCSPS